MADRVELERRIKETMGELPYDIDTVFPKLEGMGATRNVKTKLKLLKNLLPDLKTVLLDGEEVIYIARGYVLRWWEMLFAGQYTAYYLNITCVVLTDRRIIMVNSNGRGRQRHFRNQVLYTEIAETKMKGSLGKSKLKLDDGSSIALGGFKGLDRKMMQFYVEDMVDKMPEDAPNVPKSIQYLCPHCPAIYTELQSECESCGTRFKSARKAALMSLVLPGLGDLYLKHTIFGLGELMTSIVEWIVLIVAIGGVISGGPEAVGFLVFWILIMAVTNVIDFGLTMAMGKKGLIAASKPTKG